MDGPLRVAGIDMGSNALRLLVAEATSPDHWNVLHRERAPVRLGHNAFLEGHLDPDAMDAAIEALRGFRDTIERLQVHRVRGVATSAVREADDGADFIRRVKKKTGLRIEAIDGAEEARLVHRAVRDRIAMADKPWLLMDLGGGSLELALVDAHRIHWSESRRVGTVRLLEAYDTSDPVALAQRIHEHVDAFQFLHSSEGLDIAGLAATGGNINALAGMDGNDPRDGPAVVLKTSHLEQLRRDLEHQALDERMAAHGFNADRADVIFPAALVYERVAHLAGVDEVRVPGWGLREGVILDLLDKHYRPATRRSELEETVEDACLRLGRAFRFEEPHGVQTARLALEIFDQTTALHGMGAKDRRVLHAAAILHDVGKVVADKGHHKHSQYLIENADLVGLRTKEHQEAALVARYHRKALPQDHHRGYRMLGRRARARVAGLAAILRIADGLDRRHLQTVEDVEVERVDGTTVLHVAGRGDLDLEIWAARRKSELFQQQYGPILIEKIP